MLESLKFVQGAVATRDFVPELCHFHIQGGMIRGYNGMIALGGPIDLNLDICPKATSLIKAIQSCKEAIQLHVTPSGKLAIKSGKFKVYVDCIQKAYPDVAPEGQFIEVKGGILQALKKLAPFISDDASKPWSRGVLFRDNSAFSTNNVVLAEYWLGYKFPMEINIPRTAVNELIRINEEPIGLQFAENSISFHFSNNRWMRTQVLSTGWPDLNRILNNPSEPADWPDGFFTALNDIAPFVDDVGKVIFLPGKIATSREEGVGATFEVEGLENAGIYNIKYLQSLKDIATKIDLSGYPGPSLFFGENIRGAIIGMRE